MKKVFVWFLALVMLVSTAAGVLAEDVSALSDEDLLALYEQVTAEMEERNLGSVKVSIPVGTDPETGLTVEEYTAKAWPITEEEYDELVLNPENRLGQVYVVKGLVDSILEDSLQKVIICTGEDGKSLPVIVTVPATSSLLLEAGAQVRIYGEAAAPENGMPLVEGRYVYLFDEETEYE